MRLGIAFYFHDCCAQDMFRWHVKRFVVCVTPLDICGIISKFTCIEPLALLFAVFDIEKCITPHRDNILR